MYPKNKPLPPESASRAASAVNRLSGAKQENGLNASNTTPAVRPEGSEELSNGSNSFSSRKQSVSAHLQLSYVETNLVQDSGGSVSDQLLTSGTPLRSKPNHYGPGKTHIRQFSHSSLPPPPYDEYGNGNVCGVVPLPPLSSPHPSSPQMVPMPSNMVPQPCFEAPCYDAAVWNMHQGYPVASPSSMQSPPRPPPPPPPTLPPPPPSSWPSHDRAPPGMPMGPNNMPGMMQVPSMPPPPPPSSLKVPPPYSDGNVFSGARQGALAPGNIISSAGGSASASRRLRFSSKTKSGKDAERELMEHSSKQMDDSGGSSCNKSEENEKTMECHHCRQPSAISSISLQQQIDEQCNLLSSWKDKTRQMSHQHRQNVTFLLQLVASLLERITFLKQNSVSGSQKDSSKINGTGDDTLKEDNSVELKEQLAELQNALNRLNDTEHMSGKKSDNTVQSQNIEEERSRRRRLLTDILSLPHLMPLLDASTTGGENGVPLTAGEILNEDKRASRIMASEVKAIMKAVDFETTRPLSLSIVHPRVVLPHGNPSLY